MTDIIVKIMVEVLCILAIATKAIKQSRTSELTGRSSVTADYNLFRNICEEASGEERY
jgi:hypothetical protein